MFLLLELGHKSSKQNKGKKYPCLLEMFHGKLKLMLTFIVRIVRQFLGCGLQPQQQHLSAVLRGTQVLGG